MKSRLTVCGLALGLMLAPTIVAPAPASAQGPYGRWPLQPRSGVGRVVAPFLEGWYQNEDGTYTYSFGYNNLNEDVVELPLGEANFIEPSQYDGVQPTTFFPGKNRGVFTVTVPASQTNVDVWWTLTNPNGEVTKIPGRTVWSAYQLDYIPRPHGSLPPVVSFDDGNDATGSGPRGIMSQRVLSTSVGAPVTVEAYLEDVSINDPSDHRLREGTELRISWEKYQGPVGGEVEFTRHESTVEIEVEVDEDADDDAPQRRGPGPEVVPVMNEGPVRVYATFNMPGEYVLLGQADNFRRPDSSSGDQCCWSNAYVRVNVTE